jgi:hypothetical protein
MLEGAQRVFYFSASTRANFERILGDRLPVRWTLLEHGIGVPASGFRDRAAEVPPQPSPQTPLKVVFLGAVAHIKGGALMRDIVSRTRLASGAAVEWHLVGSTDLDPGPNLVQHGKYYPRRHRAPRGGGPFLLAGDPLLHAGRGSGLRDPGDLHSAGRPSGTVVPLPLRVAPRRAHRRLVLDYFAANRR